MKVAAELDAEVLARIGREVAPELVAVGPGHRRAFAPRRADVRVRGVRAWVVDSEKRIAHGFTNAGRS